LKKKQGKKKPGATRSKTRLQPVDFCFIFFLLKRRCFDLKKKKELTRATRSKPGPRVLDRSGHRAGFKNYEKKKNKNKVKKK
jgi:hypothetical protein